MNRRNIRDYDGVWFNPKWPDEPGNLAHVEILNGKSVWFQEDRSIWDTFNNIEDEIRWIDSGHWVRHDLTTNHSTPTEDDTMSFVGHMMADEVTAPEPAVIGYVVRYERGGKDSGFSKPLFFDTGEQALVIVNESQESPSIFLLEDMAVRAIEASWAYQQDHGFRWNEMYGPYCIDSVTA